MFTIASEGNTQKELEEKKQQFYQRYGVQEYYIHDPDKGKLKGWIRSGDKLLVIYQRYGVQEYYIHDPDKGKLKGWIRSGDKLLVKW